MTFAWKQIRQLVVETAETEILPKFLHIASNTKADGTLVTEVDLAVQQRIGAALARDYPNVPLLGEEMPAARQQEILQASETGYWCLDPLDGTSNFVAGMPCYAISLAYIKQGATRYGIIYDPVRQECFEAMAGEGARLNGQRLQLQSDLHSLSDAIAMVDFKRLPPTLACNLATQPPYRSQRSIGSVALDWCWLAAGRLQLYLHGGQRLWDYAAGRLIFAESDGCSILSDSLDQTAGFTPDLQPKVAIGAVNQVLLDSWSAWIAQHNVNPLN